MHDKIGLKYLVMIAASITIVFLTRVSGNADQDLRMDEDYLLVSNPYLWGAELEVYAVFLADGAVECMGFMTEEGSWEYTNAAGTAFTASYRGRLEGGAAEADITLSIRFNAALDADGDFRGRGTRIITYGSVPAVHLVMVLGTEPD